MQDHARRLINRNFEGRNDVIPFVRAWLNHPLRIGAALPSGSALAGVITAEINTASGPVIELGAGTGSFTRAILRRGVPEDQLILVEMVPQFARLLQKRYRSATVHCVDAARIGPMDLGVQEPAGAVISGLPVLGMSRRKVLGVLAGAFRHLRPDGAFYQFTYGPTCSISRAMLDHLGLEAKRVGVAWVNIPPATVFRISRRQQRPVYSLAA